MGHSATNPAAADESARMVRHGVRAGTVNGTTAGLAPGNVQGNLAILPKSYAEDFARFCALNPKPCPVIGMSAPGDPRLPALGADLDIRTDVPGYCVYENGVLVAQPRNVLDYWRDDLVAFVIGCSYSFEEALMADGMELRHVTRGAKVPMYRTNLMTTPSGPFFGPLVVSMRPLKPADAIRAVEITARFPKVHGAPVHIGRPDMIGIADLAKPDWGDAVPIHDDELPVFWACGVTPQSVVMAARPAFCLTHAPGSMLVTDLKNADFSVNNAS